MADFFFSYILGGIWLVQPPTGLILVIWRWMRSSPRIAEPPWRGYFAVGAVSLAGISVMLWVTSFIWARRIGGFGYYDPVLLHFYWWGSVTGLAGVVASFGGAGKLKWPVCGLSTLMTVLCLIAAIGE